MKKSNNTSNFIMSKTARRLLVGIVSGLVALALGITCALCFTQSSRFDINNDVGGEVSASTDRGAQSGDGFKNLVKSGGIALNDTMTYNGNYTTTTKYTLNLLPGTYTFELWGGAGAAASGYCGSGGGGAGGYAKGTIAFANATTVTLFVGGRGNGQSGGYNGGGAGGSGTVSSGTYFNAGGGGGGSSDVCIGGTNAANRVLVAAGGGGGGGSSNGGSSGMSAGSPTSMTTAGGAGGASSAAGAVGGSNGKGNGGGAATTSGGGAGGTGTYTVNTSSDGYYFAGGGGGGGGGYYGGGGGGGGGYQGTNASAGATGATGTLDHGGAGGNAAASVRSHYAGSGGGGGGGSNWTKAVGTYDNNYTISGTSTSNAQNGGNGKITITVNSISNTAPTAKTPTVATSQTLGTGKSISVTANSLGSDPDYSSNTSNTSDTVHLNTTTVYLDSNCATNANTYVTYSVSGDTITISALLKLPRAGTNGQANNTLTLYTKVKDDFKISPATTTVSFKITYATVSANQNSGTKTSGDYTYRYGRSTSANTGDVSGGSIVSPTVGEWALTVQKPIKMNTTLTVNAADLMTVTAAASYYQVYIVPNAANSAYSYSGTYTTIYNSSGTSMTGYSSLTIKAVSPSPNWQQVTWTLYVVEKASVGNTNKEPYGAAYNSNVGTTGRSLRVTFRVDNTRPTLKSSQNNVVDLRIGTKTDLSLNTYFSDADDNTIKTSTHSIKNVVVPEREFVQFDKYGNALSTLNTSGSGANKSYYNVNGTLTDVMTSGCSGTATGFSASIATKGSAGADAFLTYTFSGITLSVTGLRPSYSQYKDGRAGSAAITGGINSAPTTTAGCVLNPGHFYLLIQITDSNDTSDAGIWLPIAFTVGASTSGQAPVNTGTSAGSVSGQGTSSVLPTAAGNKGSSFYFTPMGLNVGSASTPIGQYDLNGSLTSANLQPLALDGDNFATTNGLSSRTGSGFLNEFLRITSTAENISGTIGTDANKIATVELIDIYIPQDAIGGRVTATEVNGIYTTPQHNGTARSGYYYTHGIKITLVSTTMNRYYYAGVNISDITGKAAANVMIAIKVNDTAPSVKAAGSVATYTTEASNAYGSYTASDATSGLPTITYRVPLGTTFMVTPYDLVGDFDQNKINGDAGFFAGSAFTLNGMSGTYGGGKFTVGDPLSDPANSVNALFDTGVYGTPTYKSNVSEMLRLASEKITVGKVGSATSFNPSVSANASVFKDGLFFARMSDPAAGSCDAYTYNPTGYSGNNAFTTVQTGVSGYLDVYYGDTVNTAGTDRALDFILLRAKIRTQQPAEIRLTVRDRFGAGASSGTVEICVRIEVVNTAPVIGDKTVTNLAVTAVTQGSGDSLTVVTPTTASVGVNTIMSDSDGDGLVFMLDRGLLVATGNLPRTIATESGTAPVTSFDEIPNLDNYTKIGNLRLSEAYLTAQLTTEYTLTVAAVNSTRNIEKGVFVYFFVDDGKGGVTLGYKQFEVLNTAPVFNASEFREAGAPASADPLWNIKTVASADITRPRYIVGSTDAANALMSSDPTIGFGAASADVKLLATDADPLQGLILSQKSPAYATSGDDDSYELAVPSVASAKTFNDGEAIPFGSTDVTANVAYAARASVIVSTDNGDGIGIGAPSGYVVDLLFRVNDKWYTRAELLTALGSGERTFDDVFDGHGRFSVITWAIRLRATHATEGARVKITATLRDEAEFGGDTFGRPTAWTSANNSTRVADNATGVLDASVYQTISSTGIITKSEFDEFGGYYVVLDPTSSTTKTGYVSTYDGDVESEYPDSLADIKYDGDLKLNSSGTNVIRSGRNKDTADGTLAGVHSGQTYKNASSVILSAGEEAFRYTDTIIVPATKNTDGEYDKVNVPMSFFGLLETLATPVTATGEVEYSQNYVGYDVGGGKYNQQFTLTDITSISKAITLSDGKSIWGGTGDPLSENPYIDIVATSFITAVGANNRITGNGESSYSSKYSKPYYNRTLAVPTLNSESQLIGFQNSAANKNNFVSDGQMLYLAEQTEKLAEHNFGLTFSKKNMRTGVLDLILTVKLARSGSLALNASTGAVTGRTVTQTTNSNPDSDFRTVTVNIRVENSPFDLVTTDDGVKYDADKGTYYTELTLESSQSQSFRLVRSGAENERYENIGNARTVRTLKYTDTDYQTNSAYRDYAYFMSETTNRIGAWRNSKTRPVTVKDGAFVNTTSAEIDGVARAQKSMEYFYGGQTTDDDYMPNDGKYGSNNEKFGRYFSVTTAEEGRILNIMSYKKTYINETALRDILFGKTANGYNENLKTEWSSLAAFNGYTEWDAEDTTGHGGMNCAQLTAVYASRGLVVEYGSGTKISKVYYPLKIMLYDSCGAGWDKASYVAMEFRVCIQNAAPSVSLPDSNKDADGNYFYNINLPVETNANVRLSNIVSDPDMFVLNGALATRRQFLYNASDIDAETGDYLVSPYASVYVDGEEVGNSINTDQAALIAGNGGLSAQNNTENDVIMWMSVTDGEDEISRDTEPDENVLWFSAHRRTTDADGEYINPFRFTLTFYDSQYRATDPVTFIVSITNQKPTEDLETRDITDITMRVGDHFTLFTTYYDNFIGGDDYLSAGGSTAYKNSNTYRCLTSGDIQGVGSWTYSEILSTGTHSAANFKTDTSDNQTGGTDLGSIGLFKDDTSWRLRFDKIPTGEDLQILTVAPQGYIYDESDSDKKGNRQPIALYVQAVRGGTRELTVSVYDGEGMEATRTFRIRVISSPPVARNPATESTTIGETLLEGVPERDGSGYIPATFRLFAVPTGGRRTITVSGLDGKSSVNKPASSSFEIKLRQIAKDPDGANETADMTLYDRGRFAVNNVDMQWSNISNRFVSDYFNIAVAADGKSFTVEITGYNPDNNYEELTFFIGDAGNPAITNTLKVTVQVYTFYSDMINESVAEMSDAQYNAYLAGSYKVNVKAYDAYVGQGIYEHAEGVGVGSTYAFVDLDGVNGTDDNTSPISDPDKARAGESTYDVKLYAFMNAQSGAPVPASTLGTLLTRNRQTETFLLANEADAESYLIGGLTIDPSTGAVSDVSAVGTDVLALVNKYVDFSFSLDGTSVTFLPKTATLDRTVLMYVEVQKRIGQSKSTTRGDGILNAGSLFALNVKDSAPRRVSAESSTSYDRSFSGVKGDSVVFKIYDPTDPFGGLFTDSDDGDKISILDFDPDADASYEKALAAALAADPTLDWRANATSGKARAITVNVDNEAGTLEIKINRRMDKKTGDDYADKVTFPMTFVGTDTMGEEASVTVQITVGNTGATGKADHYDYDELNGNVGYSFRRYDLNEYVIDAQILYGRDLTLDLVDIVDDADYAAGGDVDSFVFGTARAGAGVNESMYLVDEPITAIYYTDELAGEYINLARLSAVGDKGHRTGIKLSALATSRSYTATAYVRILDRSSDPADESNGLWITINVTVMNAKPYTLEGMDYSTVVMKGSKNAEPEGIEFSIGQFVGDINESDVVGDISAEDRYRDTYLRIYTMSYRMVENIYSTEEGKTNGVSETADSSALFEIMLTDSFNQKFTIRPLKGFFGTGAIDISVADGDLGQRADTLTVTFRINVQVVYDPEEIENGGLKSVTTARGKTAVVAIETIIPDITNTIVNEDGTQGAATFNPASAYMIVDVTVPSSSADSASVTHEEGSLVWMIKALKVTGEPKRINVKYVLKSDPDAEPFENYFLFGVTENYQPELIYSSLTFKRYLGEDEPIDSLTTLNTDNTVFIRPDQLLDDPEDDIMQFVSAKSQKPSLVRVSLTDNNMIAIKFNARGSAKITIEVTDETGESCLRTFTVKNDDLPSPSLWMQITSSFEANKLVWILLIVAVLVLIAVLVIIIAVHSKRRREREELEALLVSELEIEEQMNKLAGGPSPTDYQSYGYLPPTQGAGAVDPSLMLDSSEIPVTQNLALPEPDENQSQGGNGDGDENAQ